MTELVKLTIQPGVNKETTRYGAEGSWYDADKVRFRYGLPEKVGGWEHVNGIGASTTFEGVARSLLDWSSNESNRYTALGTDKKLIIWDGGLFHDITPITTSVAGASANYSLSAASPLVLVSLASHPFYVEDFGIFYTQVSEAAGVSLRAEYEVVSVVDVNSFWVSTVSATQTTVVGTSLNYQKLLSPGRRNSALGYGWGAATWGHSGGWGAPAPVGTQLTLRQWSLDTWGEDLVASPRGQAIYRWVEASGVGARASVVTGSPSVCDHILVSPEDRHLIAFGTLEVDTSVYDPTLIRWCDRENLNDWYPSATNTAGGKKLSGAQKIVGVLRTRAQILVFTEDALFGMRHIGEPAIFGFDTIGTESGLVGPHAMVETNGRVFWMDYEHFMVYDGGAPQRLPCTVLRHVFDNLDRTQLDKIFAGSNSAFGEIIWFYQSKDSISGDVDKYVIYNYAENNWSVGSLARTAWSSGYNYGYPIAAGVDSQLYFHEIGSTDNGQAIYAYLQSADFDIGDGQQVMFTDRIVPDFSSRDGSPLSGNLILTLSGKLYPNSTETVTKGPYVVSAGTKFVEYRLRARQMNLLVESSGTDTSWRLGATRIRLGPDGER